MTLINLSVCTDCLIFIANGDLPDEQPNLANRIDRRWPAVEGWNLVPGGESSDDEGTEFSWRSCESCGSDLGGARYPACAVRT